MLDTYISSDTKDDFMTFDEAKTILENDDHFLPLDPDDESYGVDGIFVSTEPKPEFQDIVMKALEVDLCRPLNISQALIRSCSVIKGAYPYDTGNPKKLSN